MSLQARSDERRVLSHIAVLEGAPPLSENWTLFEDNDALFNEARQAQAATVIFSLSQNSQIEGLARHVHALRRGVYAAPVNKARQRAENHRARKQSQRARHRRTAAAGLRREYGDPVERPALPLPDAD
ncbi:FIG005274: hypothetical protein [Cronobacter universalis NCTC 9529]|nr:FIG005274: hypothetical protein [Cronobacter universalis NCTC 9529]